MSEFFGGRMRIGTILAFSIGGACTAAAAQDAAPLPERLYVQQPWAQQPPVNLVRAFRRMQSSLSGMQAAVNNYSQAISAQAAEQNRRVLMQAELARIEEAQRPERARLMAAQRREAELDAAARARMLAPVDKPPSNFAVGSPSTSFTEAQAYELGVATAEMARASRGWGNALHGQMMLGR
jgi:alpha-beta hydrolase superfamily lysophospholipase